jgi:hypothetical protein
METDSQPHNNEYKQYEYKDYTLQECQHLQGEIQAFSQTKLFKFLHRDAELEIADFQETLVENDTIDNDKRNVMRGELRAMRRYLTKLNDVLGHLEYVETEIQKKDKNE